MIVTQALLFEDGLRIVGATDEQVESDEFSFHKTILSLIANLLPLLLIRINYKSLVVTMPHSEALNGEGFISLIYEKEHR